MTNKKLNYPAIAKEMAILTGAVAIIAAAVYFFLVPSHTSVSSISGLGIVLSNFVPLPLSAITMVLNIVLLIIGFFTCGREFGAKTVYTSVMLPVFLGLFERLFPDFETACSVLSYNRSNFCRVTSLTFACFELSRLSEIFLFPKTGPVPD